MLHIGIFYWFISFTMGFGSILLAFVVYLKEKTIILRYYLEMMFCFTLLVVSQTWYFISGI